MTPAIRNCRFAFRCKLNWQHLTSTTDRNIRFCADCQQEVHFCATNEELAEAVALNRCVAIELENHLVPITVVMGLPAPPSEADQDCG
ncbi:hypothetical protein [Pelomonas sp. KK5]|uniref:hypothetical protein n=1 Tax=Pelomonas sp. KK5 TaxID=1855730 RepID=UPI00097C1170|nr:hypothetical protein [Pelomonas sp. KK5]